MLRIRDEVEADESEERRVRFGFDEMSTVKRLWVFERIGHADQAQSAVGEEAKIMLFHEPHSQKFVEALQRAREKHQRKELLLKSAKQKMRTLSRKSRGQPIDCPR